MHAREVLPDDIPDPTAQQWERIEQLPFRMLALTPQPGIEEFVPSGFATGSDRQGICEARVGVTYAVYRYPADNNDPRNLAELDGLTREAVAARPLWPMPAWLARQLDMQRYPLLWSAVRTTWHRDSTTLPTIPDALVEHVNDVLRNEFRAQRGLEGALGGLPAAPDVTAVSVQSGVELCVDGVRHSAVQLDTDPHVYAIGAHVGDVLATVVVARDELEFIDLELVTRIEACPGKRKDPPPVEA